MVLMLKNRQEHNRTLPHQPRQPEPLDTLIRSKGLQLSH